MILATDWHLCLSGLEKEVTFRCSTHFCAALWELLQSIQHSMHFQCCKAQCIQHHELFSAMKIS